jgi:hypothetical protein
MPRFDVCNVALLFRLTVETGQHGFGQWYTGFPVVGILPYFGIVGGVGGIGVV